MAKRDAIAPEVKDNRSDGLTVSPIEMATAVAAKRALKDLMTVQGGN
jgi:hypothetical protein